MSRSIYLVMRNITLENPGGPPDVQSFVEKVFEDEGLAEQYAKSKNRNPRNFMDKASHFTIQPMVISESGNIY
jgi:hypothetical protein